MNLQKPSNLSGDFWGGLAAMLVALPSAIAFGVTIYASIGSTYGAYGALAGILGATALGLIAPIVGGTNRLVTAPCAPAAAVLSAFAIEKVGAGVPAESILVLLVLVGLGAGLIQVAFGLSRLGNLIKYMPYPVVSGYLSGVGLYIIAAQTPKLLGAPKGVHFWESIGSFELWKWQAIAVGIVTIIVMVGAPKITKAVPAAILGLLAGVLSYFGLSFFDPALLQVNSNPLIIGPLGSGGGGFLEATQKRCEFITTISLSDVIGVLVPALTLAALLSIDTLKTCVVLDALTHTRHDSNKELIGQGSGNIVSAMIGGMPGAGQMGATLVNLSSGGCTRLSSWLEGVLSLVAFLLLSAIIAWVPVSALAGILIVVGFRMIDRHSVEFLKSKSTIFDFVVIAMVVFVALNFSLILASATGIILAILLYLREQIGGKVVHRRTDGSHTASKQIRTKEEMGILEKNGDQMVVFELQGSLFFGTTSQLYGELEADLKHKKYIIIDMRKVQSIDITAAHMLEIIEEIVQEKQGVLIFSRLPEKLSTGLDMKRYFDQLGLVKKASTVKVFDDIDDAIEWVEDQIISEAELSADEEDSMNLAEFELFKGRKEETVMQLQENLESRVYKTGEKIFSMGDSTDELYLIRKGAVKIVLPLKNGQMYHLSTFGRGNFFGEMAFLDGAVRSADAIASRDTELYVVSRAKFDLFAEEHKKASIVLLEGVASTLANRLRFTNAEIMALD